MTAWGDRKPLVILQKTRHAAEAAAASAKLLESDAGHRLTSIEARFAGVEGRLTDHPIA